ncbi:sigma-54-dependent Fis family transcriptional regulator [Leptospira sp. GIMC2001]|uniref:sigma-54-dependent Fis family transcriptional regulator n=1 Tax=Leptospira sp. GIMC2001 TaxID=1513297 RepID=UPI00234AC46E|nr:sigma 54-interacting transcriptional regulator [Leptospira sp. GIMC2001]WCL51407.1 sigma 54-interacting transcriptional regulator [Leptospira sp. GIMC2001]
MNSTHDPDGLLELILDRCIQISGAESGSLMLINEKETVLDVITSRGMGLQKMNEVRLKIGQGITGMAASTGKGKLVNDVRKDADYIQVKEDILSELVVPMIVDGLAIGVISLDSNRLNAFTKDMFDIVAVLANQAAQVFKNLQTFRNLEQKTKIQATLIEIAKVVTSSLDVTEVFTSIMSLLEKSLKLEKGSIILYNKEESRLKIVAAAGLTPDEIERGSYQVGEGITGKVFESGEPVIIESVASEPNFLNRVGYLSHFKNNLEDLALIMAPINSDQSQIGVISVFLLNHKHIDLKSYLDFLLVVTSIISQTIKINKLVEEAKKEISRENIQLKRELKNKYKFGSLIGRAPNMEKLFEKIQLVSDSRASILITGESGTGKEMIASSIHYNSSRSENPFIKINCAAIPENLLESELFGHKKGSFTGAVSDKKGKFELADTGTIFLDEIGEMDLNLQSKLLRVLQEREIEAVGSIKTKKIDVRIIAATNANLETLIAEKKFRADLYYRLNVVNIHTPALRERTEDIPLLINHFIEKYTKDNSKNISGLTREAAKLLLKYQWPGNVRELENVIERAIVLSQGESLDVEDFNEISDKLAIVDVNLEPQQQMSETADTPEIAPSNFSPSHLDGLDGRAMEVIVNEVEARMIQYAMKKFRYTKTRVAKFLGINRNTLDKKIKELNIEY